jgi:serine/threonine protein kinase
VIQDFKRESQSLESLRHPSIIRILGHADDPEKRQAVLRMDWASCKLSETGSADLRDIIALRDNRCGGNKAPSYLPEAFLWHVLFHLGSALALCHHGIAIQTTQIREQVDSKNSLRQLDPDPPTELLTIAEQTPQVFWTTQQISFFKKPSHEPIVHRDIKPSNGKLYSHFAAVIALSD